MEKTTNHDLDRRYVGVTGILNKVNVGDYDSFIDLMRMYDDSSEKSPPKKFAIAAIIIHPSERSKFLAVKRPPDAKSLPDVWGLPAITLGPEERPEIAAQRLAREKLDTDIEFIGCIGFRSVDRGEYELTLMDVVVELTGKEPSVWKALTKNTKYVDQQWTNDLSLLQKAASKGSVCSRILLEVQNFLY